MGQDDWALGPQGPQGTPQVLFKELWGGTPHASIPGDTEPSPWPDARVFVDLGECR